VVGRLGAGRQPASRGGPRWQHGCMPSGRCRPKAARVGSGVDHRVKQPVVYVVMPCHDSTQTIGRAMESIARQTLKPLGVVVVDDASQDDTPSAVTAAAAHGELALHLVRLPSNAGPATARNAGWHSTPRSADYVAFLDADDWWHEEKLARQVDWMQRNRDCAW